METIGKHRRILSPDLHPKFSEALENKRNRIEGSGGLVATQQGPSSCGLGFRDSTGASSWVWVFRVEDSELRALQVRVKG